MERTVKGHLVSCEGCYLVYCPPEPEPPLMPGAVLLCAPSGTRLDLLPSLCQHPFVFTARVLWRMPLPVVWQGEDLSPLSFGHSRNPALLERWHHLCSFSGVLNPTHSQKCNNVWREDKAGQSGDPVPLFSCLWHCCLSLFLPALFLEEPSEQQLLLARNLIPKGKKGVFYVMANSMTKLQPRLFPEFTWL